MDENEKPNKRGVYRAWMKLRKPLAPKSTHYRNRNQENVSILATDNVPPDAAKPSEQRPEGFLPVAAPACMENIFCDEDQTFELDDSNGSLSTTSMASTHSHDYSSSLSRHSSSSCDMDVSFTSDNEEIVNHLYPDMECDTDNIFNNIPEPPTIDANEDPFKPPEHVDFVDTPLHENLNATKFEVLLMIMSFSFRHGLTGVAIEDLCKMVNCIVGKDSIPLLDRYWIKKIFGSVNYLIHFYCSECECYLGHFPSGTKRIGSLKCPIESCGKICSTQDLNSGHFFVTLPIKDQMKHLLEQTDNVLDLLEYRWNRTMADDIICDVYDGTVYRNLSREGNFLSEKYNLSVTCNTDGAVVFNSVKNTLYPIHFRINEFPPNVRFNQGNSLLAGLYFGKKEPNMSLFLAPFVKEMSELYETGFEWSPNTTERILSKVILLQFVLDSVAKPKVQNMNQFNGRWSCGYCLHPGVLLDYIPSNHSKFLMNNDVYMFNDLGLSYTVTQNFTTNREPEVFHVRDRNDKMVRADMEEADRLRESTPATLRDNVLVRGMKGVSVLNRLPLFDMSFGFSIDYMHCLLMGTCKSLTMLLCDKDGAYYVGDENLAVIEKKLSTICPPSSISRRPRPLSEMGHWKANEWRSWLLYYSLCCLSGSIPNVHLRHYCLLVSASFILLGDSILVDDVKKASWFLVQFVTGYSNIYGEPNVFYNVHLLLHLGKMVSLYGPWWCYSAFSFESSNGSLIRLVRGTRNVASQITEKYGICKLLPQTLSMYKVSDSIFEYCEDLLCYRNAQIVIKVGTATVLGNQVRVQLQPSEVAAFQQEGLEPSEFSYQRFVKNGTMYHARYYCRRGDKSDDTVVRLQHCDQYGLIQRIIVCQENQRKKVRLLIKLLNIERNKYIAIHGQAKAQHIKCCAAEIYGETLFCDIEDVTAKAILMKCGYDTFVTEFPNTYEKD